MIYIVHDEQLRSMKGALERTVEVKLEYETVIKHLLQIDNLKELVIDICMRTRQASAASSV